MKFEVDKLPLRNIRDLDTIADLMESKGGKLYLVGGCVRDMILGTKPNDYDLLTDLPYDVVMSVMETAFNEGLNGKLIMTHNTAKFNIIIFVLAGTRYELTALNVSLTTNLLSRDFTVNSMAIEYRTMTLIDIVDGVKDLLENKVIKAKGSPTDKIIADSIRILRSYRMAVQLGMTLDAELREANKKCRFNLIMQTNERLKAELDKIMKMDKAAEVLGRLYEDGILEIILPELYDCFECKQNTPHHKYNVGEHSLKVLQYICKRSKYVNLRYAGLFHDIGKPVVKSTKEGIDHFYSHADAGVALTDNILSKLRFSNKDKDEICALVKLHDLEIKSIKQAVRLYEKYGESLLRNYLLLREADVMSQSEYMRQEKLKGIITSKNYIDRAIAEYKKFTVKDLDINGRDLQEIGVPCGKEMGIILKALVEKVQNDMSLNTKEQLLQIVKEMCGE